MDEFLEEVQRQRAAVSELKAENKKLKENLYLLERSAYDRGYVDGIEGNGHRFRNKAQEAA